ncbi:transcriptional regulator, TetR family [Micromonospora citrea]|uniref:Transcriptional regulator, TetR family n=1 Tax=Micromonospora citrea TaxID=47855 RepID=A0A1C6TU47_9ACTN|nr:TetR/AcrR family transcriptional regulator C-terminal domain-containing protein [Micromonospora citrea]SCL45326.1 transcriptional regulator, TetR family [Micromonospora citrea]
MASGKAGDPNVAIELLWRDEEPPPPRPGLTLDRIVRAAVAVADAEGLEGLSMRKVGERLGFTSMSLYRHVPSRDQLIDLMRDAVLGQLADAALPAGGWRERLAALAREGWQVRRRHPWLAEVRGTRHVPGPNGVAHYEHLLSAVADTGLAPAEVVAVVGVVGRFVDAEAARLVDAARTERHSGVSDQDWWGAHDALYARLDRYPTLSSLWEAGGFDEPEDAFEFGLRTVLDGVEALVQRRRDEIRHETCRSCGSPMERAPAGRPRTYCSQACRQRAYRQRR